VDKFNSNKQGSLTRKSNRPDSDKSERNKRFNKKAAITNRGEKQERHNINKQGSLTRKSNRPDSDKSERNKRFNKKAAITNRGEIVEGFNSVLELLRANKRMINYIAIDPESKRKQLREIITLASSRGILIHKKEPEKEGESDTNQIFARAAPIEIGDLNDLKYALEPRNNSLFIALDSIEDPQNLGAVFRTAACFAASGIIIPKHRSCKITPSVTKVASGGIEYVPLYEVPGIATCLELLNRYDVFTLGLDPDGEFDIAEVTEAPSVCLVIGAEDKGLSALVKERCDRLVRINTTGNMDCLNAANAAAIALYQIRGK
jgi:23S rRNA (guanosine2251-2'-O)-methyltransferase